MVATTEEALAELFTDAIVAITPRHQYAGAKDWKPYDREVGGPSKTRRFRLLFKNSRLFPGGAVGGHIFEHQVELRVRTDYAGDHSETQFVMVDDFHQLRDVLSGLAATNNGLVLVEPERTVPRDSFTDTSDVTQVDHVFSVRYMRSIYP